MAGRTMTLIGAATTLGVVLAGFFAWAALTWLAHAELQRSVGRQADIAAAAVSATPDDRLATQLAGLRAARTPVAWVTGSGVQGDRQARLAYVAAGSPEANQTSWVRVDRRDVVVAVRPIGGSRLLVVSQVFAMAETSAWLVAGTMAFALAIALVVVLVASAVLTCRATRPLRAAAGAAEALAAGQRGVRLVPEGPTEVRDLARAVNELADALAASEGRQRRFLTSVSHELRTPLTAVLGYGESLADGVIEGEASKMAGATIVLEAQRLRALVDDLMALARLEADDFRVEPMRVGVADVVAPLAAVWERRCADEGVIFALTSVDAEFITDSLRLRQVLDNLLENALRVTPEGGSVVLEISGADDAVVFAVSDSGPGLTPEDAAVAFEEGELFRRYTGVRRVGTGLGLAIVRRLVRALGGTVWVEVAEASGGGADEVSPGQASGVRFLVRLPSAPKLHI